MSRAHRFRKNEKVLCHHLSSLYEAKVEQSKVAENDAIMYQLSFPALSMTEWVLGDLVVKDNKENRELKAKMEKENGGGGGGARGAKGGSAFDISTTGSTTTTTTTTGTTPTVASPITATKGSPTKNSTGTESSAVEKKEQQQPDGDDDDDGNDEGASSEDDHHRTSASSGSGSSSSRVSNRSSTGGSASASGSTSKRTYKRKRTSTTSPSSSSSSAADSVKKKKQRTTSRRSSKPETDSEDEEEENEEQDEDSIEKLDKRPVKIQYELSTELKLVLKQDYEHCTKTQKPYKLPFPETIQDLIKEYLKSVRGEEKTESAQYQTAKYVLNGIKSYFNALVRRALLYPCEKKQYDTHFKSGSRIPSSVYGLAHLLRLFVKLPVYLTRTDIGTAGCDTIKEHTVSFLAWLSYRQTSAK